MPASDKFGGDKFVPMGVQPVKVMGGGGFQLGPKGAVSLNPVIGNEPVAITKPGQMPQQGAVRGTPEMSLGSRTQREIQPPMPPQQAAEPSGAEEIHTVNVILEGPDRREYVAPFDIVAPKGSRVLGIRKG